MKTKDGIALRIRQIKRNIEIKDVEIEKLKAEILDLKVEEINLNQLLATTQVFDMVDDIFQDAANRYKNK